MRVQKFLSRAGVASRREAEKLMALGRVRVNGIVVTALGSRVDPERDIVELDGRRVSVDPPQWIALHKPAGTLSTRVDPHGRPTVFGLLPARLHALRNVGRLDQETEGLLLFTNEGDAAHGLLHPSSEVEREYHAEVRGHPTPEALAQLLEGVILDDGPARARAAAVIEEGGATSVLQLVLCEGRKREVRRMLSAVGHPVNRLVRVRFGPAVLGDLPLGAWRGVDEGERRALRIAAGVTA